MPNNNSWFGADMYESSPGRSAIKGHRLSTGEAWMPRYFLNLTTRGNDCLPNDHEPQDFPDLEAARLEAIESLREISAIAAAEQKRTDYDGIDVMSEDGRVFLRVPMSEALEH
jgi:hypothetical protein